jgi:hypothetical protein
MKMYILRTWALWVRGLILALLSVSLVAIFTEYAQAQVRFARTYGGTGEDWVYSVQQTSDGGYILTGITNSFGADYNAFLIKTDAFGNVQWAKTYVGIYASSAQQTSDGGYIVAGAGADGVLLMKTDENGNIIWAKTYGTIYISVWATSVQQTSDGGYIVTGTIYDNWPGDDYIFYYIFLIKTDAFGNVQWAKVYEVSGIDEAHSVQQTSDGGYIVAGNRDIEDVCCSDIFLLKTDANGNIQWVKTYYIPDDNWSFSFQQTSDGGYILAGATTAFGPGGGDALLIKTDSFGNIQWAKTYGGASIDWASSVQQTSDGGYILAGGTLSFGAGGYDIFLIKTDANGNIQWAKTYGGASWDGADFVQKTSDGGYIVAGWTWSFGAGNRDIFLIKTDAFGNIGSCGIVQSASPTVTTLSPTVIIPTVSFGNLSLTVLSVSPTVTSPTLTVSAPCPLSDDNELGISESCKPASGLITPYKGGIRITKSGDFEVKVYNVSGVMVKSVKGKNEVKLELSRGVYFVEVVSGNRVLREKVVIR